MKPISWASDGLLRSGLALQDPCSSRRQLAVESEIIRVPLPNDEGGCGADSAVTSWLLRYQQPAADIRAFGPEIGLWGPKIQEIDPVEINTYSAVMHCSSPAS